MQFIDPSIDDYILTRVSDEPEVLKKLNRQTHLRVLYPQMLSGHYSGRVLASFSQMIRPKRILEVGTFTGYSCICLAEGLADGGKIITLEKDAELEAYIRPAIQEAGIEDHVDLRFGDAMEIIPQLTEELDLVFIDADKKNYLSYYKMILPMVRQNGFILADNTLWDGKILDPTKKDKETTGIRNFNDFIAKDDRVEQFTLPIRDGLTVIRKK